MGGEAASTNQPQEGPSLQAQDKYVDRPSDTLTGNKNMHGWMDPEEPLIVL